MKNHRAENSPALVRAGWVIDGSGCGIQKDMLLEIRRGIISDIRPAGRISGGDPPGGLLELSRCTVLPGLIDSHVHLFMSGTRDRKSRDLQLRAGFDQVRRDIAAHLAMHLLCGVVAVRDGGDYGGYALRYRSEIHKEADVPVRMKLAGRAWHRPGRYGSLIGRSVPEHTTLAQAVVKEKDPIDCVKIVNSGLNSLVCFGKQTAVQFDTEQLKAAVKAARRRGLKTMVHANGRQPVETAVLAGCHSIEHGFFMGEENLKRMAESGVVWVPTACAMQAYASVPEHTDEATPRDVESTFRQGIDHPTPAEVARKTLDSQIEQLSAARRLGVRVALGTDSGSIGVHHGRSVVDEMKLFIRAGFSLPEAVRCATAAGAELLGLDSCGVLKKGMSATLVAVTGDPDGLPESLGTIQTLIVDGRIYGGEKGTAA